MSYKQLLAGIIFIGIAGYNTLISATPAQLTQKELPQKPEALQSDAAITTQPQKSTLSLTTLKQELGALNQQDLTAITKDIIATYGDMLTEEQLKAYIEVQLKLIDRLRSFKVTGIGITMAVDPNVALIYDNQDPTFVIYFKNPAGEIKQRRYQASIKSIGLKCECAVNLHLIVFINTTSLNYFDANEVIPLGFGGEISMPICPIRTFSEEENCGQRSAAHNQQQLLAKKITQSCRNLCSDAFFQTLAALIIGNISPAALSLTYAPIKGNGGMLLATLGFGFKCNLASVVIGGSLRPAETAETSAAQKMMVD